MALINRSTDGLTASYGDYQRGRGFSENTIKRRSSTLRSLARTLAPVSLLEATGDDLEQWLGQFRSPKTRHAYRSDLRCFYRWALRRRLIEHDPAADLDSIKVPKSLPKPLHDDVEALVTVGSQRMRRMVALGLYAGMRCGEIAALDASDVMVRVDPPVIVVRNGKGGKDRVIPMHPKLVELLSDLPSGPVFAHRRTGQPIKPESVSGSIKRHLRECAVNGTAHQLRHTFGTNLARAAGGDILLVATTMGHSSTATTMGYIAYNNPGAAAAIAKMYA